MGFDVVFDIQQIYRKVIQAFSYPGTIVDLHSEVKKMDSILPCLKATQALMQMLLDADTNFFALSKEELFKERINQWTYASIQDLEKASYIFVSKECNDQLSEVIEKANPGTLIDPHRAALILCECSDIKEQGRMILRGPGIQSTNTLDLTINCDWLSARTVKNQEFPLGVDMVFVDKKDRFVALPRTTIIERK